MARRRLVLRKASGIDKDVDSRSANFLRSFVNFSIRHWPRRPIEHNPRPLVVFSGLDCFQSVGRT